MKLSKIEITHFRCFESFALDLRPDINVIVGANGAGKTTILDALGIALYQIVSANGGGGKRERAQQKAALLPTDILIDPTHADPLQGRKDFVQFRATATDFYAVDGFPAQSPSGSPTTLAWTENVQYRPPGFSYDTRNSEAVSAPHRYFAEVWRELRSSAPEALIPLPVVAYYRAHRRITGMPELGDIFSAETSRKDSFAHALDAGSNFSAMCRWFYLRENAELRARAEAAGTVAEFPDLRAVRQAIAETIEGVSRVYFDGSPPKLKVQLEGEAGLKLELAQLSDGYRNLLALVLDFARRLAQAHPNWERPLEAPGILLVDELELHLHPRWQQTVIPSLRSVFVNTQIIVTTHSPEILSTVKKEHVHLLSRDHALETLPGDVGTYGAESSRVLAEVFGAHPRPPVQSVETLKAYWQLIESGQGDSASARTLRSQLDDALGKGDPDLRRADLRVTQLKVLRK